MMRNTIDKLATQCLHANKPTFEAGPRHGPNMPPPLHLAPSLNTPFGPLDSSLFTSNGKLAPYHYFRPEYASLAPPQLAHGPDQPSGPGPTSRRGIAAFGKMHVHSNWLRGEYFILVHEFPPIFHVIILYIYLESGESLLGQ